MVSIIDHPQLAERPEMVESALAMLLGPERAAAFIDRLGEKEPAEVASGRLRSDTAILARTLRAQGFRVEISERGAAAGRS